MMTQKQAKLLTFVEAFQQAHGWSPSFEEMAAHMGVGKSNIHWLLTKLEERGMLRKVKGKPRALEVIHRQLHVETLGENQHG
jgi:SOS-response transcriptional repressor LexA